MKAHIAEVYLCKLEIKFVKAGVRKMRCTELKRQRDKAIYECYKRGLEDGRFSSLFSAARYIMKQPAPRFYIEGRTASLLVGKLLSGESIKDVHPSTMRLACRLRDDYVKYLSEHQETVMPREWILEQLVERPAPEFYLGWRSILYVLERELKKARSRWDI